MMRTILSLAWALVLLAASQSAQAQKLSGRDIVDAYLLHNTPQSELAYMKMLTFDLAGGKPRESRFLIMTDKLPSGQYAYLVRMVRPRDVEGVTLLTSEAEDGEAIQYLYLPAAGKITEIKGDNKSGRFMGTDFTFEDLLRELPDNFEYKREPDERVSAREVYVVYATPKEPGNSQYASRRLYFDRATFDLMRVRFYDENEKIIKELEAQNYGTELVKGETRRPHFLVMNDPINNTSTLFQILEGRIDEELDDAYFTPEAIQSWTSDDVNEIIFDYNFETWGDWDELEVEE